jgi:hypothetical protein
MQGAKKMLTIDVRKSIDSESNLFQQCPLWMAEKLKQKFSYNDDEINRSWIELQRFLFICGQTNEPLSPSVRIDKIWHEAILHTRYYAELCLKLCGHFVHHIPTSNPDPYSYTRTLSLLAIVYGSVDIKYWPPNSLASGVCHGDCGSSCQD